MDACKNGGGYIASQWWPNHPQNPNLQNEGAQSDQGPTLQTVWILRKWN